MQTLVNTQLKNDASYLRLREAVSAGPYSYTNDPLYTPAKPAPRPDIEGLVGMGVGGNQVDAFNRLIPGQTRASLPSGSNRPSTRLFGTAPYRALGKGTEVNDQGLALAVYTGEKVSRRGTRATSAETAWDRFEYIDVRPAVEPQRVGLSSRSLNNYATVPPLMDTRLA